MYVVLKYISICNGVYDEKNLRLKKGIYNLMRIYDTTIVVSKLCLEFTNIIKQIKKITCVPHQLPKYHARQLGRRTSLGFDCLTPN